MAVQGDRIGDLTEVMSAAAGDWVELEVAATGLSRKISKDNLVGGMASVIGGGTINTNGHSVIIPDSGTLVLGAGETGRIAQWADANTVEESTLIKSGAGVLTLSASGAFTLTIPATGTTALRNTANTFTGNQTINGAVDLNGALDAELQNVNDSHVFRGAAGQVAPVVDVIDGLISADSGIMVSQGNGIINVPRPGLIDNNQTWTIDIVQPSADVMITMLIMLSVSRSGAITQYRSWTGIVGWISDDPALIRANSVLSNDGAGGFAWTGPTAITNGIRFTLQMSGSTVANRGSGLTILYGGSLSALTITSSIS